MFDVTVGKEGNVKRLQVVQVMIRLGLSLLQAFFIWYYLQSDVVLQFYSRNGS